MQSCQLSLGANPLRPYCVRECNLQPRASRNKSSGMANTANVKYVLVQLWLGDFLLLSFKWSCTYFACGSSLKVHWLTFYLILIKIDTFASLRGLMSEISDSWV